MDYSTIPANKLVILANKHINMYRNRIRNASQGGVNVAECQRYSHIWEQVRLVKGVWEKIDQAGRNEIRDALDSQEFNAILDLTDADFV